MPTMEQGPPPAAQQQPPGGQPPGALPPGMPQPVGPQPDPRAMKILAMLPVDELPGVARVRVEEMARAMATAKFTTFPPEWQLALVMAFTDARRAAGIATVAEQQAAMEQQRQEELQLRQQQMQMEAEARAAEQGAKGAEADKQRAHESSEADAQRSHEATENDRAGQLANERARIQASARQDTQPSMAPPSLT